MNESTGINGSKCLEARITRRRSESILPQEIVLSESAHLTKHISLFYEGSYRPGHVGGFLQKGAGLGLLIIGTRSLALGLDFSFANRWYKRSGSKNVVDSWSECVRPYLVVPSEKAASFSVGVSTEQWCLHQYFPPNIFIASSPCHNLSLPSQFFSPQRMIK